MKVKNNLIYMTDCLKKERFDVGCVRHSHIILASLRSFFFFNDMNESVDRYINRNRLTLKGFPHYKDWILKPQNGFYELW